MMKQATNQKLIEIEDEYEYQGPYSYDDPFDLADMEEFPQLPGSERILTDQIFLYKQGASNMNYKKALLKGLTKSTSLRKKLSVRAKKLKNGIKDLGHDIKHGARAIFSKVKSGKEESATAEAETNEAEMPLEKEKSIGYERKQGKKSPRSPKSRMTKKKSDKEEEPVKAEEEAKPEEADKEKEKGFGYEIRAFFAKLKLEFDTKDETTREGEEKGKEKEEEKEEKPKKVHRTKSKEHKSKSPKEHKRKSKGKGKGKEEQRQSPREGEEAETPRSPFVSTPFNVARTLDRPNDQPKDDVIA